MSILLLFFFFGSALFVQLMDQTETWYLQLPVTGLPERNKVGMLGQCELNCKNVTSNWYGRFLAPVGRAQESKFYVRFSNIFSLENL